MGNVLSRLHRNEENTSRHSINYARRTFNFLRRMLRTRRLYPADRFERDEQFEAFERRLRENFSIYNTSDSEIAEHLITIHVSYSENHRECTVYVSTFNDSGERIMDATIHQDRMRDLESECFVSFIEPQTEREINFRFTSPYSATAIKEFFLATSRRSQQNQRNQQNQQNA